MFKKLASAGKYLIITNHYAQAQKLPRVAPTGCHLIWDFLRISPGFFSELRKINCRFSQNTHQSPVPIYMSLSTQESQKNHTVSLSFHGQETDFHDFMGYVHKISKVWLHF
jgi:hypothetical protein